MTWEKELEKRINEITDFSEKIVSGEKDNTTIEMECLEMIEMAYNLVYDARQHTPIRWQKVQLTLELAKLESLVTDHEWYMELSPKTTYPTVATVWIGVKAYLELYFLDNSDETNGDD